MKKSKSKVLVSLEKASFWVKIGINQIYGLILLVIVSCGPVKKQISFSKQILSNEFLSEGVAVGDVNNDGKIDVLAGAFWFEAPDWTRHEIDTARVFNIVEGRVGDILDRYSNSMLNFAMDVNLDGWIDFIRVDFPGTETYWYENPKNASDYWKRYIIFNTVGNESPRFVDVDGDGRRDLLCGDAATNQMIWLRAPNTKGATTWEKFTITEDSVPGTKRFAHGLGYDDINGDGRSDVIITDGWWEGPQNVKQSNWNFNSVSLGDACAQMEVFDIDGDGDNDLITSSAHKRGIWWQEQIDAQNWEEHLISSEVSQTHALAFEDVNSDGQPDVITGKRYYASSGEGEGGHEPSAIVWIEFVKGENPEWILHQVDDDSGVGLNVVATDISGDGLLDIVTANKKGVFFFEQKRN